MKDGEMGKTPESFRKFTRIVVFFCILLLLLIETFVTIPLFANDPEYLNQAGLQRTRVEVLANSMLILEYRPQSEHTQAVGVIETALPIFKQEQATLQDNKASDVQQLIMSSRGDFLAITAAAQTVVDNPSKPVDPVQVAIVLAHRDTYRATINSIVTILVQRTELRTQVLFIVKSCLVIILLVAGLWYWYIVEKRVRERIAEQQNAPEV